LIVYKLCIDKNRKTKHRGNAVTAPMADNPVENAMDLHRLISLTK